MDALYHFHRDHQPVDDGLVRNNDNVQVQTGQPGQARQHAGEKDELFPTLHVIVPVATDHPIAVKEDRSTRLQLHGLSTLAGS
jgi:hypothetical protein